MQTIKTFEELRDHLWEERAYLRDKLMDRLEDITEFERGTYYGRDTELSSMIELLRNSMKYGDVE